MGFSRLETKRFKGFTFTTIFYYYSSLFPCFYRKKIQLLRNFMWSANHYYPENLESLQKV